MAVGMSGGRKEGVCWGEVGGCLRLRLVIEFGGFVLDLKGVWMTGGGIVGRGKEVALLM